MKPNRVLWILSLLTALFSLSFAQTSEAEREREALRRQTMRPDRRVEAELEIRLKQMRELEARSRVRSPILVSGDYGGNRAEWLRRIRETRKVPQPVLDQYRDFLQQHNKTGIFRLLSNNGCLESKVVRVDGDCSDFVPETSDFSFRTKDYAMPSYHDIGYDNGRFVSDAFFSQGLLVSLGDVPIETLDSTHPGVRFLAEFKPASDPSSARTAAERASLGIEIGGYRYSTLVKAMENTTYALRQVAYRLDNSMPRFSNVQTQEQMRFLSLPGDERDDMLVVFRIVRKDTDGIVTILWKELARTDAPKLKFAKGETITDFKAPVGGVK